MSRSHDLIASTVGDFVKEAVYYSPRNFSPDGDFPLPNWGDCATLSFELLLKLQDLKLDNFYFDICLWRLPDFFIKYGETGVDAHHVCISVLSNQRFQGIIDPVFGVNRLFPLGQTITHPTRGEISLQKSPDGQLMLVDGKYTWLHALSPGEIRGYNWSDYSTNPREALRRAGQMARTVSVYPLNNPSNILKVGLYDGNVLSIEPKVPFEREHVQEYMTRIGHPNLAKNVLKDCTHAIDYRRNVS